MFGAQEEVDELRAPHEAHAVLPKPGQQGDAICTRKGQIREVERDIPVGREDSLDCFLEDRHPGVEEPAFELHDPG